MTVVRAPWLVIAVYAATLARRPAVRVDPGIAAERGARRAAGVWRRAGQIDAEWWQEFRRHAQGLEATFTPNVIGFAAPLDNLSALLDGDTRPLILLLPVAIYAAVWMLLWGGVLERFVRGQPIGLRGFIRAGARYFVPFLIIGIAAVIVYAMLYATVHRVLFGPVFEWLASTVSTERAAFAWRVALYAVFGLLLLAVTAIADFARVDLVSGRGTKVPRYISESGTEVPRSTDLAIEAARAAIRLIRSRPAAVFGLYSSTASSSRRCSRSTAPPRSSAARTSADGVRCFSARPTSAREWC